MIEICSLYLPAQSAAPETRMWLWINIPVREEGISPTWLFMHCMYTRYQG